jgi:ATPase family associated with various cellular activities (AAA)
MLTPSELAIRHLALRLRPLARVLQQAVERQAELAGKLLRPDVTPLCVTDEQVSQLLARIELAPHSSSAADGWLLSEAEDAAERELRTAAAQLEIRLPLDQLRDRLGLGEHELRMLLVCVAPEIDRSYERIYAYVLDDLNRRYSCIELLTQLCAQDWSLRMQLHSLISSRGRLRRLGVVRSFGDSPTALRQQLQCAPGAIEFLLGANAAYLDALSDPEEVVWATHHVLPDGDTRAALLRLAKRMRERSLDCLAIWGSRARGLQAALQVVEKITGRALRRFRPTAAMQSAMRRELAGAFERAAGLDAILWMDLEGVEAPLLAELNEAIETDLTQVRAPLIISGANPWRPLALMQSHLYAEVELADLDFAARRDLIAGMQIGGMEDIAEDLAGRYRLGPAEAAAFASLVRNDPTAVNGGRESAVARAAALVTHRGSSSFATVIHPRRQSSDLVLPEVLHGEVLQIADFYRAWPRLREEWKLERLAQGGGMKALFAGDSGTGKTLAAEVIAARLEAPLMKVELSQVVSKWIGVTEQQLDCVFREAHDMRAVLFFDEADALFGKRGEVESGVDRYANMEVSYLLQKLEDPGFSGLVLFATNLKDNIDQAFTRRFQFVLHFHRPAESDRKRIWRLALPETSRLSPDVDLDGFARLDMTGASIVAAARTAALLAASSGANEISKPHIICGIQRQFRSEARMLLESELAPGGSRPHVMRSVIS